MRQVATNPYMVIESLSEVVDDIVCCLEQCREDVEDITLCIDEVRGHLKLIDKLVRRFERGQGDDDDDDWEQ